MARFSVPRSVLIILLYLIRSLTGLSDFCVRPLDHLKITFTSGFGSQQSGSDSSASTKAKDGSDLDKISVRLLHMFDELDIQITRGGRRKDQMPAFIQRVDTPECPFKYLDQIQWLR